MNETADDARAYDIGQRLADRLIARRDLRSARVATAFGATARRDEESSASLVFPHLGHLRNVSRTFDLHATAKRVVFGLGDSWFDYFAIDVFNVLDELGFETSSEAQHGTTLQTIAYSAGQMDAMAKLIERSAGNDEPVAILLSAGGNDVVDSGAGQGLKSLLNSAASGLPPLNGQAVAGLVDTKMRTALVTVLSGLTALCRTWLKREVPILIHGYDYPVPDGRGALFGNGPWLAPDFLLCGYDESMLPLRMSIMKDLIDRLNQMQIDVAGSASFAHVRHVDLRSTLSTASADYREFWDNELHPTLSGFERVTDKVAAALNAL